jgi:ribosomal protein S18 acetylase RimI-like enzyme
MGGQAPDVRAAGDADIEPVRALLRAAYGQYEADLPRENWERYLADVVDIEGRSDASELLVADLDGSLLGCVSYYPPGLEVSYPSDAFSEPWPREWSAIRLLAVDPSARGAGVGRLLTDACLARSREQGATGVGLHTTSFMKVARAMYERMGFTRAPAYDFHPAPTITVEAYSLSL